METHYNNLVTITLIELMNNIESIPAQEPDTWTRIKRRASDAYARIARKTWFTRAMMALFITISLFSLLRMHRERLRAYRLLIWSLPDS
jgi:hypothetical protein